MHFVVMQHTHTFYLFFGPATTYIYAPLVCSTSNTIQSAQARLKVQKIARQSRRRKREQIEGADGWYGM